MAFNGSGTFNSLGLPDFPAVGGELILASQYNNQLNDVFTGLTNCITRDGQSPATANLPMGGFKHTGVAAATASGQYATYEQTLVQRGEVGSVDWETRTSYGLYEITANSIASGSNIPPGLASSDVGHLLVLERGGAGLVQMAVTGTTVFVKERVSGVWGEWVPQQNDGIRTVASSATNSLAALPEQKINMTGTTTITSFGPAEAGQTRWVEFAGVLTITHNATSLILPNAANMATQAGDVGVFESLGSSNWRCIGYFRRSSITEALQKLTINGFPARTASNTMSSRTMTGTANEITVTNGDGVSGNPTFSLPTALTFTGKTVTGGTITNGTYNGTFTLSGGNISFPATQVPSADANTLDDYEEGTWTPVLTFATPGDVSVTYSIQSGAYTKVGNLVTITGNIRTSSFTHTTASGNMNITGLPFTSGFLTSGQSNWGGVTLANYTDFSIRINSSTAVVLGFLSASAQVPAAVTAAQMPTGGSVEFFFSISYRV